MWAVRAAVRSRAWLPRAFRRAPAPPPWPVRALAAFGPGGSGGSGDRAGRGSSRWDPRAQGSRVEEEEEEQEEEEELEELLKSDPLLPPGAQRLCLVHPEVKCGPARAQAQPSRAEWRVAEAVALVRTLDGWSVVDSVVVPAQMPGRKLVFGKGTLEQLTERIRGASEVTAVFLNVEQMARATQTELEAAWRVPVLDRFALVLHVFRRHARSKEARLQVALAELPVLRSHLGSDARRDGRGPGSRYILGTGESAQELRRRLLHEKEAKLRRALARLRARRRLLGGQRARRELPLVSVVGYTNCGKTTLVKALTGDAAMQPRDRLFATLDVTAHAGSLPCRLGVVYMDTIGFLSQLPHSLVAAFSATLEDVAQSDLVVHVRDVSHPESALQKAAVLASLRELRLPDALLGSVLEVHNKADLVPGYTPQEPHAVAVSALLGHGLPELKARLEDAVLRATGRRVVTLRVRLAGPQLSWLHAQAAVQEVRVLPDQAAADVTVVISSSAYGRFRKLFPG